MRALARGGDSGELDADELDAGASVLDGADTGMLASHVDVDMRVDTGVENTGVSTDAGAEDGAAAAPAGTGAAGDCAAEGSL